MILSEANENIPEYTHSCWLRETDLLDWNRLIYSRSQSELEHYTIWDVSFGKLIYNFTENPTNLTHSISFQWILHHHRWTMRLKIMANELWENLNTVPQFLEIQTETNSFWIMILSWRQRTTDLFTYYAKKLIRIVRNWSLFILWCIRSRFVCNENQLHWGCRFEGVKLCARYTLQMAVNVMHTLISAYCVLFFRSIAQF